MSQILLIVLLLLADDSPLVKAAKANGGAKKPMPKKPITNADVKKSSGKIAEKPADGTAAAPPAPAPGTVAVYEAQKKALAATQKIVAEKEAKVAELEKELGRVEQSYYEASDPNLRDNTIAPRFAQTKKQLDAAHAELTLARDALAALTPKPAPQPQ